VNQDQDEGTTPKSAPCAPMLAQYELYQKKALIACAWDSRDQCNELA